MTATGFFRSWVSMISAVTCCLWLGCGGGRSPHPCQGATCVPAASTFLYVAALDDVSSIRIGAGGTPTSFQNQAGPNQSVGMLADASGKFLYVSDFENSAVQAFSINPSSGLLSPISGSPFSVGTPPGSGGLAIDPGTKFLYVTLMNSAEVAGFSINATTGALTAIPGSPFPAGNTPVQAIVDSTGKFLYVSNLNDSQGTISGYTIDPASGVLAPVAGSPFPTQGNFPGPAGLAMGGAGKFLYVGMSGTVNANNVISGFSIDPGTGALTQLPGSPFPAGLGPLGIASDSTGAFLFAANSHDDTLSAYAIDASSGALTELAGSPYATHSVPVAVAVTPNRKIVYVSNAGSGDFSVFGLDTATQILNALAGSPFSIGQQAPGVIAIVNGQ